MHETSQLVGKKPQSIVERQNALIWRQRFSLESVFRDGIGDAVVEAAV